MKLISKFLTMHTIISILNRGSTVEKTHLSRKPDEEAFSEI
jgi:hypothetical protein